MAKRKTAAERRAAEAAARSERIAQTFARLEALKKELDQLGHMIDAARPPEQKH